MNQLAAWIKRLATTHRQGGMPDIFIFATPRSGSTWLAELLATQGRFKIVNEPLNVRKAVVRDNLGITDWSDLFKPEARPQIRRYIRHFIEGEDTDLRFRREKPFARFWHPRTDRIVFKMLFGGEDDVSWYEREFGGQIIHLMRHPVAVAQSRDQLPRLDSYLQSPYADNFSTTQLSHARKVATSGDTFQLRILDWCLQNSVPLRKTEGTASLLTYEQLVVEPQVVIRSLAKRYGLSRPAAMLEHVYRASRSTGKSDPASQGILRSEEEIRSQREWLIGKWRDRVTPDQLTQAFETLKIFGISVYSPGQSMPAAACMHRDTP